MRTSTGKRKKYDLDHVVNSKSDTICQKRLSLASEYIGHIVSVRSTLLHEVKVEISKRGWWGRDAVLAVLLFALGKS